MSSPAFALASIVPGSTSFHPESGFSRCCRNEEFAPLTYYEKNQTRVPYCNTSYSNHLSLTTVDDNRKREKPIIIK